MRDAQPYRPDIDGLRAVAVLAVFAFHLGVPKTGGGFVGVDIFFVISGFVIARSIKARMAAGTYSAVDFYRRRLIRIQPEAFLMIAATLAAGVVMLAPGELVHLARSAATAAVGGSNIYFWQHSGYFDGTSETELMLHSWSLGVEEQFYLLFPPLLLLARGSAARRRGVELAILLVSLLASAILTSRAPTAAFYLLPTRAWELLLGSLIAEDRAPPRPAIASALSLAGGALLALALLKIRSTMPFPGLTATLPCAAAALLIVAGPRAPLNRLLALRPVVFVGALSYSLYLWHWPVILLAHRLFGAERFGLAGFGICAVMAFGLAAASHFGLHRPIARTAPPARTVFIAAAAAAGMLLIACLLLMGLDGLPARFSSTANRLAAFADAPPGTYFKEAHRCFLEPGDTIARYDGRRCGARAAGKRNVLLFGDSTAASFAPGLAALPGVHVEQATVSACNPIAARKPYYPICGDFLHAFFTARLGIARPDLVILMARWDDLDGYALGPTIAWFERRRIPVIVLGQLPQFHHKLPYLLAIAGDRREEVPAREYIGRVREIDRAMDVQLATSPARYVSGWDLLCPNGACVLQVGNAPLLFDEDHLTPQGAAYLARRLAPLLDGR